LGLETSLCILQKPDLLYLYKLRKCSKFGSKRTVICSYVDSKDDVESCQFFCVRIDNSTKKEAILIGDLSLF